METKDIYTEITLIQERVEQAKHCADASNALIADYLQFIKSEASKASGRIVTEHDDEFSIALVGFYEAIKSYEETRGAFLKYASVIIRNRLIDEYRKEKRHLMQVSIDEPISDDGELTVGDNIRDEIDEYGRIDSKEATRQEIVELTMQLQSFGLSLTDIADNCPKQERTLASCHRALIYAKENPEIITLLKQTKKLPLAQLVEGTGIERRTLERHRKYLVALFLVYSNGYEIIRGHLKRLMQSNREEAQS